MKEVTVYELTEKSVVLCSDYYETVSFDPSLMNYAEWSPVENSPEAVRYTRDYHKVVPYFHPEKGKRYVAIHNDAREILGVELERIRGLESDVRKVLAENRSLEKQLDAYEKLDWKSHVKIAWSKFRNKQLGDNDD